MIPSYVFDKAIDGGFEQWMDSSQWEKAAFDPKFWKALKMDRTDAICFMGAVMRKRDMAKWWGWRLEAKQ